MKVKELIEELQKYDPEMKVVSDWNDELEDGVYTGKIYQHLYYDKGSYQLVLDKDCEVFEQDYSEGDVRQEEDVLLLVINNW